MRILGRRDFLKAAGFALIGPVLLTEELLAGGKCCSAGKAKSAKAACCKKKRHDLFKCINRVCDPDNMSKLERKHAPVIRVPSFFKRNQTFYLTATVGDIIHPMGPDHWIEWVEVYANNVLISRTEFSSQSPSASVTVPLSVQDEATLKVMARCNKHGIWESSQTVVPA
ncbi:MAG: hypothetical protein GY800_05760 [Planctomycetes bacterium]|nr:hypothetical protein [Planctomycetota bacterium]